MSIKKQSEQQIYGRNDMIMLEQNNKIYGSLGLADRYVMKTEEGARLILSNPKLGSFDDVLTEFNIYGMSKQVTTTGAQLLNIEPKETTVENGIVYRINYDGTIELSGTATANTYILVATLDESLDGKTAFLSGAVTDKVFIGITDLEDDGTTVADLGDGISFTFVENGTTKYVGISVDRGTTVNNIIKPMLNLGTTAKTWEKYTGGMPAPNPEYPQEIVSAGQKLSTGKNLINVDDYYSAYKQSDGTYKSKTATLNNIRISLSEFVGKEIMISVELTVGVNTTGVYLMYVSSEQNHINGSVIRTGLTGKSLLTVTPASNTDYFVISYGDGNGDVTFSELQLELSSVATSYEPYTGGVPTLYQKDIEVRVTGKNLFDANDVSKGYVSDDSGNNIVATNSYCSNFIAVSAKTKYYLYSSQDSGRWGAFYDSSKTFISGISPDKYNTVFETPENAAYIRFTVDYNNNNPDFARNVIFAKSTIAVPFEPYHEPQSLSISTSTGLPAIPVDTDGNYTDVNGQQWIADYIDLKRGKYVQRVWQKTFDGSEDEEWKKGGINYIHIECLPVAMSSRKGFCSQYIVGDDTRGIRIGNRNVSLIIFDDFSDENALSNFKAHIAERPLKVMTYLDTPIERDLTQEEIETYKNLVTYAGTTIVENDTECYMKITYMAKGN
jgi:hypothetical protein|nr:MAG TPA: hypothetical protein [Caudoviricetes sp.]